MHKMHMNAKQYVNVNSSYFWLQKNILTFSTCIRPTGKERNLRIIRNSETWQTGPLAASTFPLPIPPTHLPARFETIMSVHTFDMFPEYALTILAYTNVTNANEIIPNLQAQSLSSAVLKTMSVASLFTLLSAANRALHNASHKQLKTRALESELLYNLSPSHSITHAFKTFGVADDSTDVLVCAFNASPDTITALDQIIAGEQVSEPSAVLDVMDAKKSELLMKLYKIKPGDLVHRSLTDAISNILSVRSIKSRK